MAERPLKLKTQAKAVPEEDLSNIFTPFYRVDPSRQGEEGESGLGLSIFKAIVLAHDGSVGVKSELGKGTIFSATFPGKD